MHGQRTQGKKHGAQCRQTAPRKRVGGLDSDFNASARSIAAQRTLTNEAVRKLLAHEPTERAGAAEALQSEFVNPACTAPPLAPAAARPWSLEALQRGKPHRARTPA